MSENGEPILLGLGGFRSESKYDSSYEDALEFERSEGHRLRVELRNRLDDLDIPKPTGSNVLLAVYISSEKTKGGIIRPARTLLEDVYQGGIGLVIAKGEDCYRPDARHSFTNDWCEIGDWVMVPNTALIPNRFKLGGVILAHIVDTDVKLVIEDPSQISTRLQCV